MANVAVASATDQARQEASGRNGEPQLLVPFIRGARERVEPFADQSTAITAATTQVGPLDVVSFGFARYLLLEVVASGGDGTGGAAVAREDAPFSAIGEISLEDVNGVPLLRLSGYELFLANKYGAYEFSSDPRSAPEFAGVDTTAGAGGGNFTFMLRIPIEISGRDALGALSNMNASQTYKMTYTIAPSTAVYSTAPNTALPSVRVRAWLEAWTPPRDTDLFGNPIAKQPPAHGTTQFWSRTVFNLDSGEQTLRLPRVGNPIRMLVGVLRSAAPPTGTRSTANFADPVRLVVDGNVLDNVARSVLRRRIFERYGFSGAAALLDGAGGLDTGVFVWDFAHDLDGKVGWEMRDGYLPTVSATRLEIEGTFGGGSSQQLVVLTNDVAPTGSFFAG